MRVGVVIRTTEGFWSMTRFAEVPAVEYFCQQAVEEIPNVDDINIVDLEPCPENHVPPPDFVVDKRKYLYWCPYCQEIRHFMEDSVFPGYRHCEICHISDADYYIRLFNQLFGTVDDKKKKKKREDK